jgi:hypothetical protein
MYIFTIISLGKLHNAPTFAKYSLEIEPPGQEYIVKDGV